MNFEGAAALSWYVITRSTYFRYFRYWNPTVFQKHNARDLGKITVTTLVVKNVYKFSRSNLKIRFTFFLNSLQHLLQVVNKLNMEKGGLSSEYDSWTDHYSNTYLTILTNNSQDIFSYEQLYKLTPSNQTGQTQKWVSFRKKVLARLF